MDRTPRRWPQRWPLSTTGSFETLWIVHNSCNTLSSSPSLLLSLFICASVLKDVIPCMDGLFWTSCGVLARPLNPLPLGSSPAAWHCRAMAPFSACPFPMVRFLSVISQPLALLPKRKVIVQVLLGVPDFLSFLFALCAFQLFSFFRACVSYVILGEVFICRLEGVPVDAPYLNGATRSCFDVLLYECIERTLMNFTYSRICTRDWFGRQNEVKGAMGGAPPERSLWKRPQGCQKEQGYVYREDLKPDARPRAPSRFGSISCTWWLDNLQSRTAVVRHDLEAIRSSRTARFGGNAGGQ